MPIRRKITLVVGLLLAVLHLGTLAVIGGAIPESEQQQLAGYVQMRLKTWEHVLAQTSQHIPNHLELVGVDFAVLSNQRGQVLWRKSRRLDLDPTTANLPLNRAYSGLLWLQGQPALVMSQAVATGQGWLITGFLLPPAELVPGQMQLQLKFTPVRSNLPTVPLDSLVIKHSTADQVVGEMVLPDIYQRPALLVTVTADRSLSYNFSQKLWGLGIAGTVVILLILLLIQHSLLRPITHLLHLFKSNSVMPLPVKGGNELSLLAQACHALLDQIEAYQQQLLAVNQQLKTTETRLHNLFACLPTIAVQGCDRQHRVIFWNQASEHLYGYSAQEALGRPIEELIIPPSSREHISAVLDEWIRIADNSPEQFVDIEAIPTTPYSIELHGEMELCDKQGQTVPVYSNHLVCKNSANAVEIYRIDVDLRAQRALEKQRQEAEQKLKRLADNLPGMIFRYMIAPDRTCKLMYVSDYCRRIFGVEPELAMADPQLLWKQVHPDDRSAVAEVLAFPTSRKTKPRFMEYRLQVGERTKWVACHSLSFLDGEGNAVIDGFILDISERKQLELELDRSRELLEIIYNNSTDAIFLVDNDAEGRIRDCNWQAVSMFGRQSKAELIGMQGYQLQKHPFTAAELQKIHQEFERHGFWQGELEYITAQGRVFWGDLALKLIRVGTEELILVRVSDISDRKLAELKLQDSEQRLRLTLALNQVGAWDWNIQTNELFWSEEFYRVLNLPTTEPPTFERFWALVHPEDIPLIEASVKEAVQNQTQYDCQFRIILPNGKVRWLHALGECYYENGQPMRMLGITIDISERHEIERLKDEFISIVSHEMRTPLTAIHGALQILTTGVYDQKPDRAKRMLHIAATNCERLLRLVNDVLNLERLQSGRSPLPMAVCQVQELVSQAVEAMTALAEQQGIELVHEAMPCAVVASADGLIQVLTNLLGNAIKFSPPHSKVIVRVGETTVDGQPYLLFSVQDFGRGIPAEHLQSIFDRFRQVDASDARDKGGTGLGLAICKAIVQQHGGKIWAESELGRGSIFWFTIPLRTAATAD
ncbi:MAG: PAS domain S-box protein [Pseudanabaenaceae cyanobacterium]